MGLFLVNDLQTLPSKRADHNIYWAYLSEHFKTEKKCIKKKFFCWKNVRFFFRKSWKNITKIFFFRPISMKIFLGTYQTILRTKFFTFEKKKLLMKKCLSKLFFSKKISGGPGPPAPSTRDSAPRPGILLGWRLSWEQVHAQRHISKKSQHIFFSQR